MKYRKKPIVIDATQWFPGQHVEGVTDTDPDMTTGTVTIHPNGHVVISGFEFRGDHFNGNYHWGAISWAIECLEREMAKRITAAAMGVEFILPPPRPTPPESAGGE